MWLPHLVFFLKVINVFNILHSFRNSNSIVTVTRASMAAPMASLACLLRFQLPGLASYECHAL